MSDTPLKEYTAEQLRSLHGEEAEQIGWKMTFNAGTVKGDLVVAVLPWPPETITKDSKSRTYLYRRNALTGQYFLVKKF